MQTKNGQVAFCQKLFLGEFEPGFYLKYAGILSQGVETYARFDIEDGE